MQLRNPRFLPQIQGMDESPNSCRALQSKCNAFHTAVWDRDTQVAATVRSAKS
jgi:hypothetical protein